MPAQRFRRTPAPVSLLAALSLLLVPASASAAGTWGQRGETILGAAAGDVFGTALDIDADGDTVVVGAPDNDDGGSDAGHVQILRFTAGSWVRLGAILEGAAAGDYFGSAVSLSNDGNRVAVGAPYNGAGLEGQVQVFEYSAGSWTQLGADIEEVSDGNGGWAVALSGDGATLVMGSPFNDDAGTDRGEVRVYRWNSGTTTWDRRGGIDLAGERNQDRFGYSVAIDNTGDMIAVGARDYDGPANDASASGHVRVYEFDTGTSQWVKRGGDIDGEAAGDRLGTTVSLDSTGDVVAIGAPKNDVGGTATDAGHTVVYAWDSATSDWVQRGSDIDGAAGDDSGTSVSLSANGNSVLVGSPGSNSDAGSANLYAWDGTVWSTSGPSPSGAAGDRAGAAVALSADGNGLAVGLPRNDATASNAGAVVVFGYTLSVSDGVSVSGTPGIYLHVAGPVGRSAEGSPVYYGSDRVAHTSTYLLSIRSATGVTQHVLASGTVDVRGNLEAMVRLPALAPGRYDVVLTGQHLGGHGLSLSAEIRVNDQGRIGSLGANIPSIY
jgi:hypothetical protein